MRKDCPYKLTSFPISCDFLTENALKTAREKKKERTWKVGTEYLLWCLSHSNTEQTKFSFHHFSHFSPYQEITCVYDFLLFAKKSLGLYLPAFIWNSYLLSVCLSIHLPIIYLLIYLLAIIRFWNILQRFVKTLSPGQH